jgi:steroid delta-isomerase-like uncharacterized protein
MATDVNKKLVSQFYEEVWSHGNVEFADQIFAPDYIRHDLRPSAAAPGPQGQKKIAEDFRAAFPDLRMHVDLVVAEEDLVAARWTMEGTLTGRWGGVEPTGKPARFSGVNIFRIRDGKVVELWNHRDDLGLMQQVGAPVFAGAAEPKTDS